MLRAARLFDCHEFAHGALFAPDQPAWSALQNLKSYLNDFSYPLILPPAITDGTPLSKPVVIYDSRILPPTGLTIEWGDTTKGGLRIRRDQTVLKGAALIMAGAILLGERIAIGAGSLVEGGATIKEPAVIGRWCEVRQGAYLRGCCLTGDRCVIGHATEVKHSIFLNDAKAGHFAYLGDSILGNNTNLGAGTKCANLRFLPGTVKIEIDGTLIDTGMRKFGAMLGDETQTGCNSVTNPGTIIGKRCMLMPNTTAPSGYHQDGKRIRTGYASAVSHSIR